MVRDSRPMHVVQADPLSSRGRNNFTGIETSRKVRWPFQTIEGTRWE
jgi:hypothetical protein